MRVLFIGHEKELNGASLSLLSLVDFFLEINYEVFVLTSFNSGPFYEQLKKRRIEIIIRNYYRWCLPKYSRKSWIKEKLKWALNYSFFNKKVARELAKYCKSKSIDIIHSNTSVINIGALINKYCGIKHIWHIREFLDLDFNMYPLISKKRFYSFMNKYTDKFVFVSHAVKNHFFGLNSEKAVVVYNGIDCEDTNSHDYNDKKIVNILISGRISVAKGQEDAVKACEILLNKGIDNFRLFIAGNGSPYFEIPNIVFRNLSFLGVVKDMKSLRKEIDIELVCSQSEAFGRVTIEAMMSGIPVIGSNAGGTLEIIEDGKTGFIYEKGNAIELAKIIELLIKNRLLRIEIGNNAWMVAHQKFTINSCANKLINVYKSVINNNVY